MNILYIHQYFVTPSEAGGTRSYWVSQELKKKGHNVTMLTTNRASLNKKRETIDGINVIYLNIPYDNKMGVFKRIIAFLRFMLLSSWYVLKSKGFDLVIATSTPLTVGFPALVAKKMRGIPYIFEVRDLWPEVPIQMGGIKNKFAIRLLRLFEKKIYHNAKHIVALSPGMFDGVIKTGIHKNKVSMIPNMSKIDKFWPREKNESVMEELGLRKDSFKVIYFGAMGLANGMDYILDGIKLLGSEHNVEFMFFGWGYMEPLLRKRCEEENIQNTKFYGKMPMDRLSEIVNISDVSLVTFANLPILTTNSPNKLFDSLSAGKPIIVNSPGWTKQMVEEHRCGIYVDPTKPLELAEGVLFFKENEKIRDEFGESSRKLAENTYDKSILCEKFSVMVEKIM